MQLVRNENMLLIKAQKLHLFLQFVLLLENSFFFCSTLFGGLHFVYFFRYIEGWKKKRIHFVSFDFQHPYGSLLLFSVSVQQSTLTLSLTLRAQSDPLNGCQTFQRKSKSQTLNQKANAIELRKRIKQKKTARKKRTTTVKESSSR